MQGDGDLFDLPALAGFDAERYRRQQSQREACWRAFLDAAGGYIRGDGGKAARAFLEAVEGQFGAEEASLQRKELINWVKARGCG